MKLSLALKELPGNQRLFSIVFSFLLFPRLCLAQETNSHVSGIVRSENKELLAGANITAVHEPTRNIYHSQTNNAGLFYFFNLKPGGPYTINISYTGYEPVKISNQYFNISSPGFYSGLQENEFLEFGLKIKADTLAEIKVGGQRTTEAKTGIETNITNTQMTALPSISRNIQDFARLVPQANVNSDGGISLAGQNNKYNTFFIDGASNNDLLGLAPSGINGGQAASPPVSIEAIQEMKVSLAPYDVQYSNFTGGSINAITRSGSNTLKASAWYYFRNEQMAGKSPEPLEVPGRPRVFKRQRLSSFFNQVGGTWISGPVVKNKLFYFLLAEKQSEYLPQPYNFSDYKGNSSQQVFAAFADTLRSRYGYDAGSFLESNNNLNATRINTKLDWNFSEKQKLSLSYRYNNAERTTAQSANSGTNVRYSNNFYKLLARTHTASVEWKTFSSPKINNRFLFTYTNHIDDRNITGHPFPQIQILDGPATVFAGSNGTGQLSLFKGVDKSLLDVLKFIISKHVVSTGIDLDFSKINDIAISSYFGNYRYSSFTAFFNNAFPVRYTRSISLVDDPKDDHTKAGANYNTQRLGFFVNDDIQVNARLKFTMGVRMDGNVVPNSFQIDSFFNKIARPEIEKYYDLQGAQPGHLMNIHWQLSPRIGFHYKIPAEKLIIRGGAGLFTGHILNLWASEFYNVNVFNINIINPQFYNLRFIPDPYNQPGMQLISNSPGRGDFSLVAKKFKYPVAFKTSLSIDKKFNHNWNFTNEFLYSANIHEHSYINVNLLPPVMTTPPPGIRNVFSRNTTPAYIPIPGGNPYANIILLSNNKGQKGYSYSYTSSINKNIGDKLNINAAYTYGHSVALFEPNFSSNTSVGQWEVKTVNGKNFAKRSISDFDLGHRVYMDISKKLLYGKDKCSTQFTLFYNAQSGSPFSYVYDGSIMNDAGVTINSDLIYIPTGGELNGMIFLPNKVEGITYTPTEQKQMLNAFIENDKYLGRHRGEFAERNGARLPFTHTLDLRIQQDFKVSLNKKPTVISIIYDVFNFTNMLNRKWGRTYFISSGSYPLVKFAGFADQYTLTPQYQFKPVNGEPWSVQTSTAPGSSARWISQLGIKINFN